ncbi:hypothetical protein FGO68_gene15338 [Halteria grandinella]|uniref:Uncharacterized protein n=1 Tax=Halteria grandinella TaxID=5974 RepID=A0A8J8T7F2_HALGN|nr:hypothetical protein FGO68_gene15338 [Halteria grandinella]
MNSVEMTSLLMQQQRIQQVPETAAKVKIEAPAKISKSKKTKKIAKNEPKQKGQTDKDIESSVKQETVRHQDTKVQEVKEPLVQDGNQLNQQAQMLEPIISEKGPILQIQQQQQKPLYSPHDTVQLIGHPLQRRNIFKLNEPNQYLQTRPLSLPYPPMQHQQLHQQYLQRVQHPQLFTNPPISQFQGQLTRPIRVSVQFPHADMRPVLMSIDKEQDTIVSFCERIRAKFNLEFGQIKNLLLYPSGEIIDDINLIEKNDKIEIELQNSLNRSMTLTFNLPNQNIPTQVYSLPQDAFRKPTQDFQQKVISYPIVKSAYPSIPQVEFKDKVEIKSESDSKCYMQ